MHIKTVIKKRLNIQKVIKIDVKRLKKVNFTRFLLKNSNKISKFLIGNLKRTYVRQRTIEKHTKNN